MCHLEVRKKFGARVYFVHGWVERYSLLYVNNEPRAITIIRKNKHELYHMLCKIK